MNFDEYSRKLGALLDKIPEELKRDVEFSSTSHPGVICGYFVISEKETGIPKPFRSGCAHEYVEKVITAEFDRINNALDDKRSSAFADRDAPEPGTAAGPAPR